MASPLAVSRERRFSYTTWGMAGLAAILALYVYRFEVVGGSRQAAAQNAASHLLPFSAAAVTGLELVNGKERIDCRKMEAAWVIDSPVRTAADGFEVEKQIQAVAAAVVHRTVEAPVSSLGEYGLDSPISLSVTAGNDREKLLIGKPSPTDDYVYTTREPEGERAGGSRRSVLLVDKKLRDIAQKSLYDLRDKDVVDFSPEDVAAVTLRTHGRRVRLERGPELDGGNRQGWWLTAPVRLPADRALVERKLDLLSNIRAERFVDEAPANLAKYGLAPPWGEAELLMKDHKTIQVELGAHTTDGALGRTFARLGTGGPVFTINENLASETERQPDDWRERHFADFNKADAAELRLITPARTIVVAKADPNKPQDWRLAEYLGAVATGMNLGAAAKMPTAERADPDRVSDLLGVLSILSATKFVPGASPKRPEYGLTLPALTVVALDSASKPLATVSFGRTEVAGRYATSTHLGGVELAPAADVAKFMAGMDSLAAR